MLSTNDFMIVVYNFLEVGSAYRSDLVDLFGTPDGSKKGYLGSIHRPLRWDWGETGFRKIISIICALSGRKPDSFEKYFLSKVRHKENIIQTLVADHIIDGPPAMLYVFKHSSKKIPAFVAEIQDVSWIGRRIWITFLPRRYMLLDPATWKEFWNNLFTRGREDPQKWLDMWENSWNTPRPPQSQVQQMLHSSFTQDQYHIIPIKLLIENIKKKIDPISPQTRTCFIKDITKVKRRLRFGVPTDNQAFWGILSEFVHKTQVKGRVELKYDELTYEITDIPANTISEQSLVFKQEIGAARTICQAMLDVFDKDYLDTEFSTENRKSILDSVFIKRAIKVSMVAENYEQKYGETDFDYLLDLSPLSEKYPKSTIKILFDLTAGLWNKSVAKSKEEFLEQWQHNLIKLPEMNSNLYAIWHYGLVSEIKDGSYKGLEVGDYLQSKTEMEVIKYKKNAIRNAPSLPKLILLPFFRDADVRLEKELDWISSDKDTQRRKSKLYRALREVFEHLRTAELCVHRNACG